MIFTVFPTLSADPVAYEGTWGQMCAMVRAAPPVPNDDHRAPLIKLAALGTVRSPKGHLCHDANFAAVYGIEGDYDAGVMPPEQAALTLQLMGVAALVFTTKRHTAAAPRWRVMVPLSAPCAPADRIAWAERLNCILGGILARESGVLSQRYYYGPRAGVAAPLVWEVPGAPLDVAAAAVPRMPWEATANRPAGAVKPADWDGKTAQQQAECLADLRAALAYLDPDDRISWIARGQELAGLGDAGFDLWAEWSATSSRFPGGDGLEETWVTLGGQRTDYRAVFTAAERKGWKNPARGRAAASVGFGAPMEEGGATAAPAASTVDGRTLLFADEQIALFKGCTYVDDIHMVLCADGVLRDQKRFNVRYGGFSYTMDRENQATPAKQAWDCFTNSQAVRFPKADSTCFRPELPAGAVITEDGRALANTYRPIETEQRPGDPAPFLTHLSKLFPVERDRAVFLAYLAAVVQYPGVKFQWAPVVQGAPGCGKTLFADCIEHAVGYVYCHRPNAQDLGNKFTAWIERKLFIAIEEVCAGERVDLLEALKPLITNARVEIQGKGRDQVTGDNRANFLLCSNHKDAVRKTKEDRRYAVFYCPQQTVEDLARDGMAGDYFPALYAWLRAGGYAVVNDYLRRYQIPQELNPATHCMRAPETSSTAEAIEQGRGTAEQEVLEAIALGRVGFRGDMVSSVFLDQLLQERRRHVARNKRRDMMRSIGYDWHPALNNGRVNNAVLPDAALPTIYVKLNSDVAKLHKASDVEKTYANSQNSVAHGTETRKVVPFRTPSV